jgi:hypothetical protein
MLLPDYVEPKRKRRMRSTDRSTEIDMDHIETESLPRPTNSNIPVFKFNKWPRQHDPRLEKESIRF